MTDVTDKVERAIARFDRVTTQLDQRGGVSRQAAERERRRLNAGLGRTASNIAIAIVGVWAAVLILGLVRPIGMTGFLVALLTTAIVAGVLLMRGGRRALAPPAPSTDLANGPMVERFDSYLYRTRRALPAPAQAQLDQISAVLPPLKQTLERINTLDPNAQDARRLMSVHLPGLIDRYMHVPSAYRSEQDGEGKTVDERLVESLAAGRAALAEISEQLARADLAAFETQGRFIQSRYGDDGPQGVAPDEDSTRPRIEG